MTCVYWAETADRMLGGVRVGVQDNQDASGSTLDKVRAPDLLELARSLDPSVTERTLEYWRAQGLLPRPERIGQEGKRPVWSYPPGTGDQLTSLLQWRRKTKDPNMLRAALWYDGFPVDTDRVRQSMAVSLQGLIELFDKEVAKRTDRPNDPGARWQAIQAIARTVASKRTKGIPRLGRQALSERSAGVALTFGLMTNEPLALQHLEADAPALERLMGVDRGRRFKPGGAAPWLDGPPEEGLASFAELGGVARLLKVLKEASDAELELARSLARTLIGGISALSRIADAIAGRDNAAGFAWVRFTANEPSTAVLVVPLLVAILRTSELASGLDQVLTSLQANALPVEQRVKELLALPEAERAERLKNLPELPFAEQLRIRRLLTQFSDKPER
jgi:hypothetical protein